MNSVRPPPRLWILFTKILFFLIDGFPKDHSFFLKKTAGIEVLAQLIKIKEKVFKYRMKGPKILTTEGAIQIAGPASVQKKRLTLFLVFILICPRYSPQKVQSSLQGQLQGRFWRGQCKTRRNLQSPVAKNMSENSGSQSKNKSLAIWSIVCCWINFNLMSLQAKLKLWIRSNSAVVSEQFFLSQDPNIYL